MGRKLKSIMLIDDNEAINFIHENIIKIVDCAEAVTVAKNGEEALRYLNGEAGDLQPKPDLILLDINMPVLDGWGFLEEFDKLSIDKKEQFVIIVLTSSLNPDDEERALAITSVSGFKRKPLTPEGLNTILEQYF